MTDKKLVTQILKNDTRAIKQFYSQNKEKLTSFVKRKIDHPEDVEEIVQDTFWATLNSLPNFKFRSSLSTFLHSIARREIADFYRKKRIKTILLSRFPFLETLASKALGPEEETLKKELKEEILKVLKKLPPRYQKLLRLKYLEEYSIKEIAFKLASSPKAIESALSRARKKYKNEGKRKEVTTK